MNIFTCQVCGKVSHHPKDYEYGYCAQCQAYTGKFVLIIQRTFKTGVQSLWLDDHVRAYYISIKNRSYTSLIQIPYEKVDLWKSLLS